MGNVCPAFLFTPEMTILLLVISDVIKPVIVFQMRQSALSFFSGFKRFYAFQHY